MEWVVALLAGATDRQLPLVALLLLVWWRLDRRILSMGKRVEILWETYLATLTARKREEG